MSTIDQPNRLRPIEILRFLFDVFRRLIMLPKPKTASRLLAVFALATLSLATVAEAQPSGPGQGGSGNMMGGGWGWGMGWGMGGFGWFGVLVFCLLALGIVVVAFRRRKL
jgi:uncharacterized membrane protein